MMLAPRVKSEDEDEEEVTIRRLPSNAQRIPLQGCTSPMASPARTPPVVEPGKRQLPRDPSNWDDLDDIEDELDDIDEAKGSALRNPEAGRRNAVEKNGDAGWNNFPTSHNLLFKGQSQTSDDAWKRPPSGSPSRRTVDEVAEELPTTPSLHTESRNLLFDGQSQISDDARKRPPSGPPSRKTGDEVPEELPMTPSRPSEVPSCAQTRSSEAALQSDDVCTACSRKDKWFPGCVHSQEHKFHEGTLRKKPCGCTHSIFCFECKTLKADPGKWLCPHCLIGCSTELQLCECGVNRFGHWPSELHRATMAFMQANFDRKAKRKGMGKNKQRKRTRVKVETPLLKDE